MTESGKLWKTIERELLSAQDIETIVLKSHLLVESQINAALEFLIGLGIEKARLSFVQKLEILICIWPDLKRTRSSTEARSLYSEWKELNGIRNKIAHQLSTGGLRKLLIDWVTGSLGYRLKTINRTAVLKRNFVKAVVFQLGSFSGYSYVRKDLAKSLTPPKA
ncbi:MAG: hypothetical protein OEV49_17055 [candidate division Zixibacteria bacterium]|nr:hypothetical protein [candidate division Zixibacteria bacterium]MDH3936638.1 hypothetical protein [candidate division Zixibacteria bacterium]MDH4034183.1 hypothetical protein [candidate division Zixibacteria bacterium]